jgi:hypothetical protein
MQTIVTLSPKDSISRIQKTDGYFNATHLLQIFNEGKLAKEEKAMHDFIKMKQTTSFVEHLKTIEGIEKPIKSSNKGTWMHPLVFIDFCMWLSLEFKTMALKWVLDGLIKERNMAGDYYGELVKAICDRHIQYYGCTPKPLVYINEARFLKQLVGIEDRNEANENQLIILNILQRFDITLIKEGGGKDTRYKQLEILAKSLK